MAREKNLAFLSDSGSPQIPKESEGTRSRGKYRNKKKRGSPQHIISNFLGRSRTSKFEDRSENRMRFSERSRICLIPRRHAPANPFGGDPIACNLLLSPENRMRFSGDRGDKSEIRVAGRGKRQIQRIWTFVSFIQTARHANLTFVPPKLHAILGGPNGFAGACLRRIKESRDRSPRKLHAIFGDSDQRSVPGENRCFLRFRYFFLCACFFPLPRRGRGNKNENLFNM